MGTPPSPLGNGFTSAFETPPSQRSTNQKNCVAHVFVIHSVAVLILRVRCALLLRGSFDSLKTMTNIILNYYIWFMLHALVALSSVKLRNNNTKVPKKEINELIIIHKELIYCCIVLVSESKNFPTFRERWSHNYFLKIF